METRVNIGNRLPDSEQVFSNQNDLRIIGVSVYASGNANHVYV